TLIVSADAAESGCVNWLKSQLPDDVRVVAADTDFTTAALVADAAVLLFPCWGVPDPALIARWQAVLAARPEGTSHVVLGAAELMKSDDARRTADNVVRKWLMPTEGEPAVFRWSADDTPDDRESLRAALDRPLSGVQKQRLNVVRLSHAVDLLEAAQPP